MAAVVTVTVHLQITKPTQSNLLCQRRTLSLQAPCTEPGTVNSAHAATGELEGCCLLCKTHQQRYHLHVVALLSFPAMCRRDLPQHNRWKLTSSPTDRAGTQAQEMQHLQ
jgi:hypothetical protein